MLKDKNLKIIILIFLLILLAIFLLQKINLTTADLGRFIKNGEAIFTGQFRVLTTNFYAYTNPDSYFINHHWATGVLFYIFWKIGGFAGLHFFSVVIGLTTFLIFFYLTKKESGFKITAVVSLILIPLIGYRSEIRPELFTYFFSAIFFMLLWRYKNKSIAQKWLFVLPIMEILWVNIHIYFFLGIAIFGAFLLEQVIVFIKNKNRESRNRLRFLFIVFAFCLIATLVNPFGLRGAIHPLNVYKNYGYRVFEEQSIWFLERLKITDPSFLSFKIVFVLLVLSFVLVLTKNRKNLSLVNLFLAIGFGFMAMVAIRNFTIFGLFALPIMP